MWEPRRLTTLWSSTAWYRDSFTLPNNTQLWYGSPININCKIIFHRLQNYPNFWRRIVRTHTHTRFCVCVCIYVYIYIYIYIRSIYTAVKGVLDAFALFKPICSLLIQFDKGLLYRSHNHVLILSTLWSQNCWQGGNYINRKQTERLKWPNKADNTKIEIWNKNE
jgi:hypothetical protein